MAMTECNWASPMSTWALSPVHTSNNVEVTLSNATSRTILLTKSNVASKLLPFFDNNVQRNFVILTDSKQIQFVSTLSKGRNFTINSFDIVAFLATKSHVASTKSNVASTFLVVWTGL